MLAKTQIKSFAQTNKKVRIFIVRILFSTKLFIYIKLFLSLMSVENFVGDQIHTNGNLPFVQYDNMSLTNHIIIIFSDRQLTELSIYTQCQISNHI